MASPSFPVAQIKTLESPLTSLPLSPSTPHITCLTLQQILLALASKYIQNPTTSHHFKHYNLGLSHYHLSPGWVHRFLTGLAASMLDPTICSFQNSQWPFFKHRQILSLLCTKLTNALLSHSFRWKPKFSDGYKLLSVYTLSHSLDSCCACITPSTLPPQSLHTSLIVYQLGDRQVFCGWVTNYHKLTSLKTIFI